MFHISLSIVKLQFGMYCSVFYFLTTDWRIGNTNEMSCLVVVKPYFKNFQEINVLFLIKPYWVYLVHDVFTAFEWRYMIEHYGFLTQRTGNFLAANSLWATNQFTATFSRDFFFLKILSTTFDNGENWEKTSKSSEL